MNKLKQLLTNLDHENINIKFITVKYYFIVHLLLYISLSMINYYLYIIYYSDLENNPIIELINNFSIFISIIIIPSFIFVYVYAYLINHDYELKVHEIIENNLDEIEYTLQKQKELITLVSSIYLIFSIIYSSCYTFQIF